MKNKLFLVCPDCHVENTIKRNFEGNLYFATALGAVFTPIKFGYAESLNGLINREEILEIYVVNDIYCRFINNVLDNEKGFNTKEENALRKLFIGNIEEIMQHDDRQLKSIELAKINILQQVNELRRTEFIGQKYESGYIQIKGLLFDRKKLTFEELNLTHPTHESAS
jgi:carbonic anhydrase